MDRLTDEERQTLITDIYTLVHHMENNPILIDLLKSHFYHSMTGYLFESDTSKEDVAEIAKAFSRIGETHKDYTENYFTLSVKFPSGKTTLKALTHRETVCTQKIIGYEIKEVPDYDNVPNVTKEVPIVEWECDPVLAPSNDSR